MHAPLSEPLLHTAHRLTTPGCARRAGGVGSVAKRQRRGRRAGSAPDARSQRRYAQQRAAVPSRLERSPRETRRSLEHLPWVLYCTSNPSETQSPPKPTPTPTRRFLEERFCGGSGKGRPSSRQTFCGVKILCLVSAPLRGQRVDNPREAAHQAPAPPSFARGDARPRPRPRPSRLCPGPAPRRARRRRRRQRPARARTYIARQRPVGDGRRQQW